MRRCLAWPLTLALAAGLAAPAARPARAQATDYTLDLSTRFDPLRLEFETGVWRVQPVGAWNPWGFIDLDACSPTYGTCLTGWTTQFEVLRLLPGEELDDQSVWTRSGPGVTFWNSSLAVRHGAGIPPLEFEFTGPGALLLRVPLTGGDPEVLARCPSYPLAWCPELGPTPEPPLGEPEIDPGEAGPAGFVRAARVAALDVPAGVRVRVQRVDGLAITTPEPATSALVAAGLAAVLVAARRRAAPRAPGSAR